MLALADDRPGCEIVSSWLTGRGGSLPAVNKLTEYPIEYQRAVIAKMSVASRQQFWRDEFARFYQDRARGMSASQREVFVKLDTAMRDGRLLGDQNRENRESMAAEVRQVFTTTQAMALTGGSWADRSAPKTWQSFRVRTDSVMRTAAVQVRSLVKRAVPSVSAQPLYCNCSNDFWCTFHAMGPCDDVDCEETLACGLWWEEMCIGICRL